MSRSRLGLEAERLGSRLGLGHEGLVSIPDCNTDMVVHDSGESESHWSFPVNSGSVDLKPFLYDACLRTLIRPAASVPEVTTVWRYRNSIIDSKTVSWSWYCQILTDLDKNLQTPIVIRNTLVGRLRPRSAPRRLQAKPNRLFL